MKQTCRRCHKKTICRNIDVRDYLPDRVGPDEIRAIHKATQNNENPYHLCMSCLHILMDAVDEGNNIYIEKIMKRNSIQTKYP